jgi:hypothetical protein
MCLDADDYCPYELPASDGIIQHWECFVTDLGEETFFARLQHVVGPEEGDLEAEIYLREIDHIPELGEIFDWRIGVKGGQPYSEIKFRHFRPFTAEEIAESERKAQELAKIFEENDGN